MDISLLLRLFTRWLHLKLPQKQPVDQGVRLKVCTVKTFHLVIYKMIASYIFFSEAASGSGSGTEGMHTYYNFHYHCIKLPSYTIIPHCNLQTLLNILNSAESNFVPEQRTIDSLSPNQPVCVNISSMEVDSTELFAVFLGTSDPGVVVNSSARNARVAINRE